MYIYIYLYSLKVTFKMINLEPLTRNKFTLDSAYLNLKAKKKSILNINNWRVKTIFKMLLNPLIFNL